MKMKSFLALAALTAAGTASAAITSANTLCRIEVASSTKNTIVAVPLKTIAGSEDAIKLTDLVLTDGLAAGDHLLHKGSSGWEAWVVASGKWTPMAVSDAGVTSIAGSDAAFACGDAFWLVRENPSGSFYLYGEVTKVAAEMPAIARGSAPTYIMMANTALEDVAITALPLKGTVAEGDKIQVPVATGLGVKEYTFKDGSWKEATLALDANGTLVPTVTTTTAKIPAGQGFWYVAKASAAR